MKKINLDKILKSYLTVEAMQANKPDYTYNMVITAMKHACCEVLDLAAKNAKLSHRCYDRYDNPEEYAEFEGTYPKKCDGDGIPYAVDVFSVNKQSILQIKDWIK